MLEAVSCVSEGVYDGGAGDALASQCGAVSLDDSLKGGRPD